MKSEIDQYELPIKNFESLFLALMHGRLSRKSLRFEKLRILALLHLVSGIPILQLFQLKWNDIFSLDSEDLPVIRPSFTIRNKSVPIYKEVAVELIHLYQLYKFPSQSAYLFFFEDSKPPKKLSSKAARQKLQRTLLVTKFHDIREGVDETLPSILFGRRVFEVNGYSARVANLIKKHLGFNSTAHLLKFLGYKSKSEISDPIIFNDLFIRETQLSLSDKNFNSFPDKFSFQKFTSFYHFLSSKPGHGRGPSYDSITLNIKSLLFLSLNLGISPYELLELKWKDVLLIDKSIPDTKMEQFDDKDDITSLDRANISAKSEIDYMRTSIPVPQVLEKEIIGLYNRVLARELEKLSSHETLELSMRIVDHNASIIDRVGFPDIEEYVFTDNKMIKLNKRSLTRSIRTALKKLGFKHYQHFKSSSTQVMFGRRVLEVYGCEKFVLRGLKKHLNQRTELKLITFLSVSQNELKSRDILDGLLDNMPKNDIEATS